MREFEIFGFKFETRSYLPENVVIAAPEEDPNCILLYDLGKEQMVVYEKPKFELVSELVSADTTHKFDSLEFRFNYRQFTPNIISIS